MWTTINREFFEKWKDIDVVMLCKTKEYAEEFCRLMHYQGLSWNIGDKFTKKYVTDSFWDAFKSSTAYDFNTGKFCNVEWYLEKDYTILDFEDYIDDSIDDCTDTTIYVLTQYCGNVGMKDEPENEKILKAYKDLSRALEYDNREFKKSNGYKFCGEDYLYISKDEDLGNGDYLNYRIYEVELR